MYFYSNKKRIFIKNISLEILICMLFFKYINSTVTDTMENRKEIRFEKLLQTNTLLLLLFLQKIIFIEIVYNKKYIIILNHYLSLQFFSTGWYVGSQCAWRLLELYSWDLLIIIFSRPLGYEIFEIVGWSKSMYKEYTYFLYCELSTLMLNNTYIFMMKEIFCLVNFTV